jgi:hypothetical protein
MVIGRGGNWAKWLGGEMAKGRIGYGRNGEKIGRNGNTPSHLHVYIDFYELLDLFTINNSP